MIERQVDQRVLLERRHLGRELVVDAPSPFKDLLEKNLDLERAARRAEADSLDDTEWARRMIIRLDDVTWPVIRKTTKAGKRLEARIQGTGNDGGPSCATVKPIGGWNVVSD